MTSSPIDGAAVAVVGTGPLAGALSVSLMRLGAELVTLDDAGPLDAAVYAPWDPADVVPCPLVDLTDDEFETAWQVTLDDAVATCVKARASASARRAVAS